MELLQQCINWKVGLNAKMNTINFSLANNQNYIILYPMSINYITLIDVKKGMHGGNRMVIINCKNCKDRKVGNHIEWIKDPIRNPKHYPLHKCLVCNVETKLKESDLEKIKKILDLTQIGEDYEKHKK